MPPPLETWAALLRGVNVGGNNLVPMAELRACLEAAGLDSVRTLLASGNAVFRAPRGDPRVLERRIERALRARFGAPLRVLVRRRAEIDALVRSFPRSWRADGAGWRRNVMFLRHAVDRPAVVDEVPAPRPGIEELHYRPGALLWAARLDDLTRTAMLRVVGTPVYQELTVRLASTVERLRELLRVVEALPEVGAASEPPAGARPRRRRRKPSGRPRAVPRAMRPTSP